MHIYADSWKLTEFVTSPQKPVQNFRPFLLSLVLQENGPYLEGQLIFQYYYNTEHIFHDSNQAYIILTDNLQNGIVQLKYA